MKGIGEREAMDKFGYKTKIDHVEYTKPSIKMLLPVEVLIRELVENEFFGTFQISFEKGYITHCKKTETVKL